MNDQDIDRTGWTREYWVTWSPNGQLLLQQHTRITTPGGDSWVETMDFKNKGGSQ